jgi:HSP20 family molecular chaperone IbpA
MSSTQEKLLNEVLTKILNPSFESWNEVPKMKQETRLFAHTPTKLCSTKCEKKAKTPICIPCPDWYEVQDGFEYHLDVPGFMKEELTIVYEDKTRSITVTGAKSTQIGDHNVNRSVNQVFRIPEEAQPNVTVVLENGVLVFNVPREVNARKVITIL